MSGVLRLGCESAALATVDAGASVTRVGGRSPGDPDATPDVRSDVNSDVNPDVRVVDVMIVGAGFAGSILARCLNARGVKALLVEKGRHPRFALGESSTPLGNLVLERLAVDYRLEDLYQLAAYGRWRRSLPFQMRGLKRGFSFFRHRSGAPFSPGEDNRHLLMVAASPADEVADCQWLRADVDEHLVERAITEGVEYLDRTEIVALSIDARRVAATLVRGNQEISVQAGFVVDGTGEAGIVARAAAVTDRSVGVPFSTRLLFSHFTEVPRFEDCCLGCDVERLGRAAASGRGLGDRGVPYPPDSSAVHHLLDFGWMYQLRFDDRRLSCGIVVETGQAEKLGVKVDWQQPGKAFLRLVQCFPTLERQLSGARPLQPIAATGRLQRRRSAVCGDRWALLPHTYAFYSPLFSTGIAWSLVAVERLAQVLARRHGGRSPSQEPSGLESPVDQQLETYGRLVESEADHLESLLGAAYGSLGDRNGFFGVAEAYLAAASFSESCQRLCEPDEWCEDQSAPVELGAGWAWRGFLGATDAVLRPLFEELREKVLNGQMRGQDLRSWIGRGLERRNVAGLGYASPWNLVPADPETVIGAAPLLGLDSSTAQRRRPRLLSPPTFAEALLRHRYG